MKRQPYLPDNDAGILAVLTALADNLPGALATKYEVDATQLFRLQQGRLVYGWFLAALDAARQWSQSLTADRDRMSDAPLADSEPLPGMPLLPAVATIVPVGGPPAIPVQLEHGFFEFLSRLVQQMKSSEAYDEADGILLKIVGPEVPPPDPAIVPEVKYRLGPNGRPILIVKKSPFQGYKVEVARGNSPAVDAGFSSSREFELPLALPAPGQAEVWTAQVQYRYRNAPFGQKSMPLVIPVRGS